MHRNTKVATCCYCGARAALTLGEGRHELVCSGCGAPLHDLKMLPSQRGAAAKARPAKSTKPRDTKALTSHDRWAKKSKKKRKKKSLGRKFLDEAFDALEDIFD